jgi:hypothetical protein
MGEKLIHKPKESGIEADLIEETFGVLSENFELKEGRFIADLIYKNDTHVLDEINKVLAGRIRDMMENNFEKLQNILYRIDVDQQKVHELFSTNNRSEYPSLLAGLIIDRQLAKIKTRRYYKSHKDSPSLIPPPASSGINSGEEIES